MKIKLKTISALRRIKWIKRFLDSRRIYGLRQTLFAKFCRRRKTGSGQTLTAVYPRNGIAGPCYIRDEPSDFSVFYSVFFSDEMECVQQIGDATVIIDAGANIGFTSLYLARAFPKATIIAIEPDAKNFELLLLNTRSVRDRVTCVNAAVWSECCSLIPNPVTYRDGLNWSRQFIVPTENSQCIRVEAISIDEVMRRYSLNSIDLLKIDIEGAEFAVFSSVGPWFSKTKAILIELHDDSVFGRTKDVFQKATANDFKHSCSGEKVFAVRVR